MAQKNVEIEAKFYIKDLDAFREHLLTHNAERVSERVLERNWRFDTPQRDLTTKGEVLRIREDQRVRLTYKRPIIGTLQRREIELEINNFTEMKALLEALGYEVFFIYEKYRETFRIGEVEIVLDEVPYGSFIEIEGPSIDAIREIAKQIHIAWNRSVSSTYLSLFEELKDKLDLPFINATFDSFTTIKKVNPEELNLQDALQIGSSTE
jgi:adenylate cyclase class 2